MKLYHGTNYSSAMDICINGVDLNKSQRYLDFGAGFYTTPSYEHAAITAIRKTKKYNNRYHTNEAPCVVEVRCNLNYAGIKIKQFAYHSDEWASFVIGNRLRDEVLDRYPMVDSNRDCKYDIVYGEIADGSVVNIAYDINNGVCSLLEVNCSQLLKAHGSFGYQYSFHTIRALDCISFMECSTIRNEEKYSRVALESRKR